MKIHLAIYHPKHAGILSAAIELNAESVLLLHRSDDDVSGLQSALQARGIKCLKNIVTFDTQMAREQFAQIIEQH
ncbi:MAG: hypothetical protein ACSHWU_08020, partial [Marinicella sp.]